MYSEVNLEEEFANKHNKQYTLLSHVRKNYKNSPKSQLLNSLFLAAIAVATTVAAAQQ